MRARSLLFLLGSVGCLEGGQSAQQPVELQLSGALDLVNYHDRRNRQTALGGTQTFELRRAGRLPGALGPALELPFEATVDEGSGVRIEARQGASITIRGVKAGTSTLRIFHEDGAPMDELSLVVAEIQHVVLEPRVADQLPRDLLSRFDRAIAWAPGEHTFGVDLYGADPFFPLGDTSMQLALAGAEHIAPNKLRVPAATVGTSPISVTAGSQAATIDFVVVDQADSASLITNSDPAPTSLTTGRLTSLCYQARNAGRYIMGLRWTFTVAGAIKPQAQVTPNCIALIPTQTSGDISVTAAAAGRSVSMTLPVVTP